MTTEEKDLAFRAIAGFCAFFAWVFLAGYVSNVLGKNEEKWKKNAPMYVGVLSFLGGLLFAVGEKYFGLIIILRHRTIRHSDSPPFGYFLSTFGLILLATHYIRNLQRSRRQSRLTKTPK